jgi:hypothetical protein
MKLRTYILSFFIFILSLCSLYSVQAADISINLWFWSSSSSSGWWKPEINCVGLPGCSSWDIAKVSTTSNKAVGVIWRIIWEMIKYTSVLAVIALMIAGIMYLLSWWEEERVKKAKKWIIWSLLWVIVSVSAWFIVNLINNLSIF